jgi:pyruvate dehydrogenase E1 component beta subunit
LGAAGLRVLALNTYVAPEQVLIQAILEDDDPVLLVEHKLLYPLSTFSAGREFEMHKVSGAYPWSIVGIAGAPRADLTLAAYGYMAEIGREVMHKLAYEKEIFVELVVPTQLSPFDLEPFYESVRKTGKILAIEEGSLNLGWSAELAARSLENIRSNVRFGRAAARNMPVPAAATLEQEVLPQVDEIVELALGMMER